MIKRTKEQRQNEIKPILKKLNELHLKPTIDGIKQLYQHIKTYIDNSDNNINNNSGECNNINDDENINIHIPCPELNILIKGVLEVNINKKSWVKLECLVRPEEE
tara:strand:+ start:266 stop:580 length:315 start_codon:yes stop_codon:yes gene_type:complete